MKALRRHPLLVGTGEVFVEAARYIAVMLIVLVLLVQFAKVAFLCDRPPGWPAQSVYGEL